LLILLLFKLFSFLSLEKKSSNTLKVYQAGYGEFCYSVFLNNSLDDSNL